MLAALALGCSPATFGIGDGGASAADDTESEDGSDDAQGSEAEGGDGDGDPGDGDGDTGDGDGESGDGDAGAMCGNGVTEAPEECDGEDLGGRTCESVGFPGGELSCAGDCTLDTSGCLEPSCGNGIMEAGEACDGSDLGGQACADFGEGPGQIACSGDCTVNLDDCGIDGDGEPCGDWGSCPDDGLYCFMDTCWDGSVGDPCFGDSNCVTDNCTGGWGDNVCE
ncbi:Endo-1,4-beta-xylanase A precursor [Enhygromyxa salina]|uniref:Endo-1,4-beta-xylanase A n=1 Tax=Enhygromyxa salina TaxID=215803 RepID=A0A0C1ZWS9_9BACT|nr:Endo-1,4-beta-xylanase A precursor [Enhygromyxa salina]